MSDASQRTVGPWIGYAAAVWSFAFGALHAAWATGIYIGLRETLAQGAFQRSWFRAYNVLVVLTCALGGLVALAMARPWRLPAHRRAILVVAWCGTVLLVLRGGGAVVKTVYLLSIGQFRADAMQLYDAWFCLGAVLFGFCLWRFHHSAPEPGHAA